MNTGTEMTTRQDAPVGFESGSKSLVESEVGAVAVVAREESEIKAAIVVAKNFPRDEFAAHTKIIKSAQRPSFAEGGFYSFKRGGAAVEGPSVKMARELARVWGNVRHGLRIVSIDDDYVHVKGWALDLETNAYVENEDKFRKLIERKNRGWVVPDERDLRELINKRGAICVRNSVLQVMPPDIVDEAVRVAKTTMISAAKGEIEGQSREEAARRLALAFADLGVTTDMLQKHLGHSLDIVTDEEVVKLRGIYTSLNDGHSKREEHFDMPGAPASDGAAVLGAELSQNRGGQGKAGKKKKGKKKPPKEDENSPLTVGEANKLRSLMDSCDVEFEDAERYEQMIKDEDGPGVRTAIKDLQKRAIGVGAES